MSTSDLIISEVYGAKDNFAAVLTDTSIVFEREAEFAIQAILNSDYAMKVALNNKASVFNAVTNIAAIGISLNPAKKQAYLVPRDSKICLDISYIGLMDLAMASGSVRWVQAMLVHEGDEFELNGFDKPPRHKYKPFDIKRGAVVGVYVVAKTMDGDYLTTTMPIDDVWSIRDRSSAWKAWISKQKSCPWVTDPGEMVKKTCVKRAYKYWPKTDRMDQAIHYMNTEAGEGFAPIENPAPTTAPGAAKAGVVERLIAAALKATTSEAALEYWKTNKHLLEHQPADYKLFKNKVTEHRRELLAALPQQDVIEA